MTSSAPLTAASLAAVDPARSEGGVAPIAGAGNGAAEAPPALRLPKNKAEAHFQLRLLEEELGPAGAEKGPNAAIIDARALRDQAQAAFDRADFTEALRLSLKGRRRLGAKLETLPPGPVAAPSTSPSVVPDPGELYKCSSCGEILRPSDRFCRYCGTLRGPSRCPTCGTAADTDDRFCSGCGATLSG
jgi:hypothetical protein